MRWFVLALLLASPAAAQTTATFVGEDRVTSGRWRGVYGSVCVSLYNEGGTPACPESFVRGAGTLAGLRWPIDSTDPTLPQHFDGRPGTFGAGFSKRDADGVPMRTGHATGAPGTLSLYFVDYIDPPQASLNRKQRIDVYAQGPIDTDNGTGHIGISHANGALLDSRTIENFQGGVYLSWVVTGPVNFQYTALPNDTNGLAVVNGVFLDPVDPCPFKAPPTTTWPDAIPQGKPFTVMADHTGLSCTNQPTTPLLTTYCLFDTTIRIPGTITPSAGASSTLACPAPLLPIGPHTVQVGVTNASGENRSDILAFTISQVQPAPVDCVLSAWSAWSAWAPINATQETRTRTRTVVTPASNGGMACPSPLLETETRAIVIAPPTATCRYIAPGSTVVQQRPIGTVIRGINQIATQAVRWPLFLSWWWRIEAIPLTPTTVDITITCIGAPVVPAI